MARDPETTRTQLLDAAEALVLDRGFAGAGVDAIVGRAGLTKGAFFHHFPAKSDLADALVERWSAGDAAQLDAKLDRAESLSRSPAQQLVIFVGLFIEEADSLSEPDPGCLFGAMCYQGGLLEERTWNRVRAAMLNWRDRLREKIDQAAGQHPLPIDLDRDALADFFTVTFEGAFIMAKATGEASALGSALRQLRTYLELVFGLVKAPGA